MKIYQRIFFDTQYYEFEVFTAKTEQEANLKAWKYIVDEIEKRRDYIFDDVEEFDTFEKFCERKFSYFPYRDGGSLECTLVVTEI